MKPFRLSFVVSLICGIPLLAISVTGCSLQNDAKPISDLSTNSNSQPIVERQQLSGLSAKIESIAEKITVRIDADNENGSGVIVARQGNNYYVVTAAHVVKKERPYQIVTPDGQEYSVENSNINKLTGADLAILQFQSDRDYEIATLGVYESKWQERFYGEKLSEESYQNSQNLLPWIFLFGWQRKQNIPQAKLTAGRIDSKNFFRSDSQEVKSVYKDIDFAAKEKGYQLRYTNFSQGGMSGGALLDTEGRVIGIHLAAEGKKVGLRKIQLGMSLGTRIQTFLDLAAKAGFKSEWFKIETSQPEVISEEEIALITNNLFELTPPDANAKASDWVNYGNNLWRISEYEKAIEAFDRAIAIQPDLIFAYFGKGLALHHQGSFNFNDSNFGSVEGDSPSNREALAVFEKIIELDSNFAPAWNQKALVLWEIGNSKIPTAEEMKNYRSYQDYMRYFESIKNIPEYSEALAAWDKAIEINPENDQYHIHKSLLFQLLQRYPEAITAISKAIEIEPSAMYYSQRSLLYKITGDIQNSQADLNHLKEIEPNHLFTEAQSK